MTKAIPPIYFGLLILWTAFEYFCSLLKKGKRLQAKNFENFIDLSETNGGEDE